MKPEEGFAVAAVGLGKYVVEGEKAYRFSPKYPDVEINSPKDQYKNSQVNLFAVDLKKKDIDLSFDYSNGQEIIIENKVKSIPYKAQLVKYSKNHNPNRNYILLSLSVPLFFNGNNFININTSVGNARWHYLSYADLSKIIGNISVLITNNYHKQILDDYQSFIDCLVALLSYCNVSGTATFDFHSTNSSNYNLLKGIRMHDFYLKKKYELFGYLIYQRLLNQHNQYMLGYSEPLSWQNNNVEIFTDFNYTNGDGLVDVKFKVSANCAVGIQIQGDSYRMFVESPNGIIAKNVQALLNNNLWFIFDIRLPAGKTYPTNPVKVFNSYSTKGVNTFVYKSKKLGDRMTINDIIDIIISDMTHLNNNLTQIKTYC